MGDLSRERAFAWGALAVEHRSRDYRRVKAVATPEVDEAEFAVYVDIAVAVLHPPSQLQS